MAVEIAMNIETASAGGGSATLFTVPVGKSVAINKLCFSPVGGAADLTLTVYRQADGETTNFLAGYPLAANAPFKAPTFTLEEGDTVSFSAANHDIHGLMSWVVKDAAPVAAGALNLGGPYAPPTVFNRFDLTEENGSTYICLTDGTSGELPSTSVNFMLFAAKGGKGDPGDDGATDYEALTNRPSTYALSLVLGG